MTLRPLRHSVGILVVAAIALAATAAPASAIVANTAGGRVSYWPLNGAAAASRAGALRTSVPPFEAEPPLLWHGGPVMHSQTAYAIFWAPGGASDFPSGYIAAVEGFLKDVASDSGKPTNVYSVSAQYEDGSGHATYSDTFGGSTVDTDAYPTSGTCPPYEGFTGVEYTSCISDAKLAAEANAVLAAKSWPHGLGDEYYMVLPPHVGSCFGTSLGSGCFDAAFCAYHSYTGSPEPEPEPNTVTVYANISYSPGDVFGCGVGEYPNGHVNGNVDDTLSSLSHEANESITDPTLEAWFDSQRFENGDECRNTQDESDYGNPLGGSPGALFNQTIGTHHYYLQQEWSNDTEDCAQLVTPAVPSIADPSEITINESVPFDGSGSTPGAGGIASFLWHFGDGGTSTLENPSHTFASLGSFPVSLTVTDDGGFTYTTEREVTVLPPAQPPEATSAPATGVTDTGASLNGSVNPMGRKTTFRFEYGTTTAYGSVTSTASAGSGSSAVPVSAPVGGLAPSTTYHFRLSATNVANTVHGGDLTFTTAATPPPPPPVVILPPPEPPPGAGVAAVLAGVVKGGSAQLSLSCQGGGACNGTLELIVRVKVHRHGTTRFKKQAIGRATFRIPAGASQKLTISLTALGKALLKAAGRAGLRVTASGSGLKSATVSLKRG